MKKLQSFTLLCLLLCTQQTVRSQVFEVKKPDYNVSPFTGVTRQHWKDAALYLLNGAFSYVKNIDDALVFPKEPGVSYPVNASQYPVEKLEGLCRTLFIATPLLKEDSNIVVNNIRLIDYYRHHLNKLIDSASGTYIAPRAVNGGPHQALVEFGALSICFFAAPDQLWHPLSPALKAGLARTMLSYGDGPTNPSNWRFFNVFVLSFFKSQGYTVNEPLLKKYLDETLTHYRGSGWYADIPAFDYYSMWAFQFYGMLWSEFFGNKHYPGIAAKLTNNFRDMETNYPYAFARDGKMIMWGRSITYRFGAVGPLALTGLLPEGPKNPGWYRRIASGSMLQFLQNPEFLKDRVPTLGFYGTFDHAIQYYSCRGSVYWLGKSFMALLLPADNPFWTAKENEGAWEDYDRQKVYNRFHPGSNILVTNYPATGMTELRAWSRRKVNGNWNEYRANENYNRLAYNSAFTWQADGSNGEGSMAYLSQTEPGKWEPLHLYDFVAYDNNVYYRRGLLESDSSNMYYLADVIMPNGVLRVDKYTGHEREIRLGHYSLPEIKGKIKTSKKEAGKYEATIIDNGEYQLAMVPLAGWKTTAVVHASGRHPVAKNSATIIAGTKAENDIIITLQLWKKSGKPFTTAELQPVVVQNISPNKDQVTVRFADGKTKTITFSNP